MDDNWVCPGGITGMFQIVSMRELAPRVKMAEVKAPEIAEKSRPGQFIVVRVDERGERIPLTIADYDPARGTVSTVFQEVGVSTEKLGRMKPGESVKDFVGPLGTPSEMGRFGVVTMVGGGLGVPPLYPQAKALRKLGNTVVSVIGARTTDLLVFEEEMRAVSDELHVATDDGSKGFKGFVTDLLRSLIERGPKPDRVIAVGPAIMMKAVSDVTRPFKIKTIVSLNSIMVDATGMCGACRVSVGGRTRFTCVHGPEFDGHQVDFEELMARLRTYVEQEKSSLRRYQESQRGA